MLHWTSKKVKAFISLIVFVFFVNHFAYLSVGRFDYAYNMKANIVTGIATGIGWIGWYVMQRKRKPYAWKILLFQMLVGISLLLELNDFPPLFWVLDAHSLWHLSTVLPTVLLYRWAAKGPEVASKSSWKSNECNFSFPVSSLTTPSTCDASNTNKLNLTKKKRN